MSKVCISEIKSLPLPRLTEIRALCSAGLEHLPYKQRVGGSNPSTPTKGWLPEWPNGADCKSAGYAYGGSNPSPPTPQKRFS